MPALMPALPRGNILILALSQALMLWVTLLLSSLLALEFRRRLQHKARAAEASGTATGSA